jgi:flagellar protein FlaG
MTAIPRAVAPPAAVVRAVASTTVAPAKQETANTAPQPVKAALSTDELKSLASEIQRKVSSISSDLQFSVDEETGKDLIRVTDRTTKKIVWQFPSEEALNITKALDQYQKGVMLNRRA